MWARLRRLLEEYTESRVLWRTRDGETVLLTPGSSVVVRVPARPKRE